MFKKTADLVEDVSPKDIVPHIFMLTPSQNVNVEQFIPKAYTLAIIATGLGSHMKYWARLNGNLGQSCHLRLLLWAKRGTFAWILSMIHFPQKALTILHTVV